MLPSPVIIKSPDILVSPVTSNGYVSFVLPIDTLPEEASDKTGVVKVV